MKAGVDAPLKMSGIWKYAVEVGADASNRVAPQEYNSCPSENSMGQGYFFVPKSNQYYIEG
jgi:hypothetical protein